ncbi:formiminotetrahydrofolate cyclodeaminase [Vreelandella songnenensis]|uniref:Formiminotetrahydrofolate cyclodeaminase n=1 Tax=Vreelandella songnenensis TaxID=1176243 RepID=A0A2T0V1Z4_9GAMM|nr:cyclodeaminase/cyclohydrolase family protein [Halomonas songnenensis]PRY64192.1 formiminotetrahydrofolate cyclodeaminase [Halomonas songnenensis]
MQEAKDCTPVWEQTLSHFRDALAHRPMPGCGAAASVTASLGVALILKGLHLSQQHETSEVRRVLIDEGERLNEQLSPLADKDIAAFEELMSAFQMPQDTEHKKASRHRAIQQAAATAVDVPLATARLCQKALSLGERAGEHSEKQFASDTQAGGELLAAALRSVLLNVEANTDLLGSEAEKRRVQEAYDALKEQAVVLLTRI